MTSLISPPNNINIEASLLGCLLSKGTLFEITEESGLQPEDFYELKHQDIYRAIHSLFHEGKTPDLLTVSNYLSTAENASKGIDIVISQILQMPHHLLQQNPSKSTLIF